MPAGMGCSPHTLKGGLQFLENSTPVFLPGESAWTREPGRYSPRGHRELDTPVWLSPAPNSSHSMPTDSPKGNEHVSIQRLVHNSRQPGTQTDVHREADRQQDLNSATKGGAHRPLGHGWISGWLCRERQDRSPFLWNSRKRRRIMTAELMKAGGWSPVRGEQERGFAQKVGTPWGDGHVPSQTVATVAYVWSLVKRNHIVHFTYV